MFDELYNTVKLRFGAGSSTTSMGDWITQNTSIKKKPFSFEHYHFQKAIADDMHPDMSVKKCSQIGLTEIQIRKFLAMLTRGTALAGIFTLPNEKMFTRIYNGRIKPILEADDIFNPPTANAPVRRRDQVQIRDSFGYITGCTEGDATSTSADFLFHDEYDLSPQTMMSLYQSRLQNSDMHITQRFSTPTFRGYGIDKLHTLSDQREYMARCNACNHWQIPIFTPAFVHIEDFPYPEIPQFSDLSPEMIQALDLTDSYVKCENCQRRLDLGNPEIREWVAINPGRTGMRGYQVRPFSTSRLRPNYVFGQLAKYQSDGFLRGFYNTVLGEPYTEASAQLQRPDIEACMAMGIPGLPNISPDTPVFLGVDIGITCWLTLSVDDEHGRPHFILYENFHISDLAQRISDLRKAYTIVQGASDRFPYTPTVEALRDETGMLVMPVQYRGAGALAPVKDELGNLIHYSANRTSILDRLHSLVSHHSLVISGYTHHRETVLVHLSDMVRDEQADVEAVWKKTSGNDHYFHAMALSLLARRVCEHMYYSTDAPKPTSTLIAGADWMGDGGSSVILTTSKGLHNIARIG